MKGKENKGREVKWSWERGVIRSRACREVQHAGEGATDAAAALREKHDHKLLFGRSKK